MERPSVTLILAIALAKPFTLSSSNADFKLYTENGDKIAKWQCCDVDDFKIVFD